MKKIIFILLSGFMLNSCVKTILKKNGILDKQAKITKLPANKKEALFIEMVHLAKEDFYQCRLQ